MADVRIGFNRWDWSSARAFVDDVVRGEAMGFDAAFIPISPLLVRDGYVLLGAAALATSRIRLGPLIDNPMIKAPAVAAGAISTVDEMADGRTLFVYGIGDTAVRLLGRRPARVTELEDATSTMRRLLAGRSLDVGADRPAVLNHARPVPVWIAAGGPKTLRMAGRVADGVFIRVGTHPGNIRAAVDAVRAGAAEVGRDPTQLGISLIFHTVAPQDAGAIQAISRSMAAGYYEYSPALFSQVGLEWTGPPIETLQKRVWPDFHHAADLEASGAVVDFLSEEVARSFSLFGDGAEVAHQLRAVLAMDLDVDIVVPHPVPTPGRRGPDFKAWIAEEVLPHL